MTPSQARYQLRHTRKYVIFNCCPEIEIQKTFARYAYSCGARRLDTAVSRLSTAAPFRSRFFILWMRSCSKLPAAPHPEICSFLNCTFLKRKNYYNTFFKFVNRKKVAFFKKSKATFYFLKIIQQNQILLTLQDHQELPFHRSRQR